MPCEPMCVIVHIINIEASFAPAVPFRHATHAAQKDWSPQACRNVLHSSAPVFALASGLFNLVAEFLEPSRATARTFAWVLNIL